MLRAFVSLVLVLVTAVFGCSSTQAAHPAAADAANDNSASSDDAASDAGDDGGSAAPYPAPHASAPTVANLGGHVLVAPKIVPVTFPGDPWAADIDAFAAAIGTSAFWSATTKEYGVGPAAAAPPIHLAQAAPASTTDSAIQTWIASNLQGTSPAWGAPDSSAIYTLFYPSSTVITSPNGLSCHGFQGYHSSLTLADGTTAVYVVVSECAAAAIDPFSSPKGVELATGVASHEWIEASTDPFLDAFAQPDDPHLGWLVQTGGGEVADMCAFNPGAFGVFAGLAHSAQRSWSNAAATAGHDPCVPHVSAQPYFNSVPVLSDAVSYDFGGQSVPTKGVRIPAGGSKTISVDLFSEGPTSGPWTVAAADELTWLHQPKELDFSFDRTTGRNGDVLQLTIKVLRKDPSYGAELFAIVSTLGDESNIWYGVVGN